VTGVFLATAHPAKFLEEVQPLVSEQIIIPERLAQVLKREKAAIPLTSSFDDLKQFLMSDVHN
jgi:threonine synthase